MNNYKTRSKWFLSMCRQCSALPSMIGKLRFPTLGNPALLHRLKSMVSAQRVSDI